MDADTAQTRLLDAAEELFNEHGIQAVGMDTIRSRSGVSLSGSISSTPPRTGSWRPY